MITGQTVKNTYQGDGSNREFTITFEFTDASQVKFKVNGEEVTTNFSLNTVAKTLTYPTVASELDPLTSADEIEIYRDTEITQDIEFNNGGPLNADMIEDGLDKLTMIGQEIKKIAEGKENGLIIKPEGTDIDSLKAEGLYYIKNPTSTLGMPKTCNYPNIIGGYAIVSVTIPPVTPVKVEEGGTYFVYQEMVLWVKHFGMDSIDAPEVFTRNLTDYTYVNDGSHFYWQKLTDTLSLIYTTETTIDYQIYRNCRIIINGTSGNVLPTTGITSLTINNIYSMHNSHKTEIIFKAGSGFSLNINVSHYALVGEATFEEDKCYILTISGDIIKIEEISLV